MKRFILSLSFILIFTIVNLSSAAFAATIFGPTQYVRTTGAPDIYSDIFQATAGPALLIVTNGASSGDARIEDAVSSARVVINDIEIFGVNDFNSNVYCLEAGIDLLETNTLYIELNSKPILPLK